MRYISLFSGIEAATVAWHALGWEPIAFAEVDKFCCGLLRRYYTSVPNLGDVSKVNWAPYRGRVDVLVGGSPCQAFSVAGLRQSLKDARGNLTLEYVRAVHAIRPRYAVWENVPGVLSTTDNAFGCFLAALIGADEALEIEEGWPSAGMVSGPEGSAAWRILDAQYFGLAQRRQRVFLVWCPAGGADPGEILFERPRLLGHPPARGEAREAVAGSLAARTRGGGGLGTDFDLSGGLQPVAYGGNNTGGAIDVATACRAKGGTGHGDFESETFVTHALRTDGFDASEDGTGRGTPLVPVGAFNNTGQGWWTETDGVAGTVRDASAGSASHGTVLAIPIQEVGKGTGAEGDPMHTLQAGAQHGVLAFSSKDHGADAEDDLSPTLRAGGHAESHANAGVPPAIAFNLRGREGGATEEATFFQDDATLKHASEIANTLRRDAGGQGPCVSFMGVRRLTPVECARLQGFPDDYLDIPYRGKPAADGPKYKALGNSMAVPVMAWIGRRIMEVANGSD